VMQNALEITNEFSSRRSVIRGESRDVARSLKDRSLDFVFLDGDHTFNGVLDDLREWSPKVRENGIISGHDFYTGEDGLWDVRGAVLEYLKVLGLGIEHVSVDIGGTWFVDLDSACRGIVPKGLGVVV